MTVIGPISTSDFYLGVGLGIVAIIILVLITIKQSIDNSDLEEKYKQAKADVIWHQARADLLSIDIKEVRESWLFALGELSAYQRSGELDYD